MKCLILINTKFRLEVN